MKISYILPMLLLLPLAALASEAQHVMSGLSTAIAIAVLGILSVIFFFFSFSSVNKLYISMAINGTWVLLVLFADGANHLSVALKIIAVIALMLALQGLSLRRKLRR